MNRLRINVHRPYVPGTPAQQERLRDRSESSIGGPVNCRWAVVDKVRSDIARVDVTLSNGVKLRAIGIASFSWAGENSNHAFGKRDYPPQGSEVLVMFPDGTLESAFILCSRLSLSTKMKAKLVGAGLERDTLEVTEWGWEVAYDKDTGVLQANTPAGNDQITLLLDTANHIIRITQKDGATAKNEVVMNKTVGITMTDRNGNTLVMDSTSMRLNGNFEVLR
jgi:hypothetical protein